VTGLDRDALSADALLTDLYLDALLAGAVLDAVEDVEALDPGRRLDPLARRAADRLRRDLVRVHPSFRFEERIAARLAAAAVAMRVPIAVGGEGQVVPFPRDPAARSCLDGPGAPDDLSDPAANEAAVDVLLAGLVGDDLARRDRARPLLIGGALTSAAISIAGAAFVAWRLRPNRALGPMARAARAVRDARHEQPALSHLGPVRRPRRLH
jgi:hypothetical protein